MSSQPSQEPTTSAWAALRRGADADAFAEIFRAHHQAVYNYAFRRLANWTLAEEVTQGVFLALWRRAAAGRVEPLRVGSVVAVLLAMARQECLTMARSQRRRAALADRLRQTADVADESETDRWLTAETTMAAIQASLTELTADQRDAIELVWWSGLSTSEAAEVLGVPPGTVKSRLARARQTLSQSQLADLRAGV